MPCTVYRARFTQCEAGDSSALRCASDIAACFSADSFFLPALACSRRHLHQPTRYLLLNPFDRSARASSRTTRASPSYSAGKSTRRPHGKRRSMPVILGRARDFTGPRRSSLSGPRFAQSNRLIRMVDVSQSGDRSAISIWYSGSGPRLRHSRCLRNFL